MHMIISPWKLLFHSKGQQWIKDWTERGRASLAPPPRSANGQQVPLNSIELVIWFMTLVRTILFFDEVCNQRSHTQVFYAVNARYNIIPDTWNTYVIWDHTGNSTWRCCEEKIVVVVHLTLEHFLAKRIPEAVYVYVCVWSGDDVLLS